MQKYIHLTFIVKSSSHCHYSFTPPLLPLILIHREEDHESEALAISSVEDPHSPQKDDPHGRRVVILLQHVKCFPLGASFIRFVNIAAVDSHPILSNQCANIFFQLSHWVKVLFSNETG